MSETSSVSFAAEVRRCALVFGAILVGISLMVGISFTHLANPVRIGLILAVAAANAALVSCFLMHLLSERKFVITTLIFTAIFFVALMGLTMYAHHDMPRLQPL